MRPKNSAEIRQAFLDYFQEMGHELVPSAPLPMRDNPTLLFTNAGMNQFVDTFLGREERPYRRAVSSQKCMRVQGKHNDLENVGPSPRHHTFFEMLGNFSFGDYFKEGAIRYAFEFLTVICGIPADRLWYTVHRDDEDAYSIWIDQIGVSAERILRMGDKTNFWMMGDVGPCGPTSEIHYDWGPERCTCGLPECSVLLDNDCGRWLEVWNLVFMQYDQAADGSRIPLPRPGVDTGMGLERITSIVEGEPVNYDTDLFRPMMELVQQALGHSPEERRQHETGYRVIADHGRAATFLIADGVLPGNAGRGYVLRMIIRRAARFGRKIGFRAPFLAGVADLVVGQMGQVYPELAQSRDHIMQTLTLEEERFARTLDAALEELDEVLAGLAERKQNLLPGETAFRLYATFGLPLEITRDVAAERRVAVDEVGYQKARDAHSEASGAGAFGQYQTGSSVYATLLADLVQSGRLDRGGVDYDPYGEPRLESEVLALIGDGEQLDRARAGERVELVTAATPFYVEAGGEVSDTGRAFDAAGGTILEIEDTRRPVAGLVVHQGQVVSGELFLGQALTLEVDDPRRWDIRRNHTATHLLHRELRAVLGKHVTQQGSLVAPDRLRFDFSHGQAVGPAALSAIEREINRAILANLPVTVEYMKQKEAIGGGAMALFGEKYGEVVRTIRIGSARRPHSFELCGGLHVEATGDIGLFRFTREEAVGAGLRRVEAVSGRTAQALAQEGLDLIDRIGERLNVPPAEIERRLDEVLAENRSLQRGLDELRRAQSRAEFEKQLGGMTMVDGAAILAAQVSAADVDALREMADWFRDRTPSGVAVLAAVIDARPMVVVAVTGDLVERGVRADQLVKELSPFIGGGGGGRPTLAQAGGKDSGRLAEALGAVPGLVGRALAR
jgi:alanyl-tRNA synthetase